MTSNQTTKINYVLAFDGKYIVEQECIWLAYKAAGYKGTMLEQSTDKQSLLIQAGYLNLGR